MKSKAIEVFISHSSKDADFVALLVELFGSALGLPKNRIRCTSVAGTKLHVGAPIDFQIRSEVLESRAFVAVVSPASLQSTYCMFELGARWGVQGFLAPLLEDRGIQRMVRKIEAAAVDSEQQDSRCGELFLAASNAGRMSSISREGPLSWVPSCISVKTTGRSPAT
jgi:TIR domain